MGALVFLDSSHTYRETVGITHYTKSLRVWCRSPLQGARVRRYNDGIAVTKRTKISVFQYVFYNDFLLVNLFFARDFLSLTAGDTDDNFAYIPPDF